MPIAPAFCDSCGTVFSSGIFSNITGVSFSNVEAGPCPNCGGMGHIPDGIYNFVGNTIELVAGSQRSVAELGRLAEILKQAQQKGTTVEEVSKTIKEELPELSSLADALPKKRTELYAFIAILLTIIGMVINKKESTHIEVHQVINNVIEQSTSNKGTQTRAPIAKKKKVGRNELCPCGSGKKYKRCCGA